MKIDSEILINAPPHIVRETFLDFPNLHTWHDGSFWKAIVVEAPGKTTGMELVKGDAVKCTMPSMSFKSKCDTNTPTHFCWANSFPLLGGAAHHYYWNPAPDDPNKTIFSQHEDMKGAVSMIMSAIGSKGASNVGWKKVNEDLKAAAEKKWAAAQSQSAAVH